MSDHDNLIAAYEVIRRWHNDHMHPNICDNDICKTADKMYSAGLRDLAAKDIRFAEVIDALELAAMALRLEGAGEHGAECINHDDCNALRSINTALQSIRGDEP